MTNAALWVQMFADILEMDVETIEVKELGALGADMAAGDVFTIETPGGGGYGAPTR